MARRQSGNWVYYEFDAQGSASQRLDSSGNVLSSSVYDAYGGETNSGTPTDPFGYNAQWGYWLDRDTGLYLCQARWYDPVTGRWVTRDPIGYAGGTNLYGYCGGGPAGAADPEGNLPTVNGFLRMIVCAALEIQIQALASEVKKRFWDLYNDPLGLYPFGSSVNPDHPTAGTWEGHQQHYQAKQRALDRKLSQWYEKCMRPRPDCSQEYRWRSMPAPDYPGQRVPYKIRRANAAGPFFDPWGENASVSDGAFAIAEGLMEINGTASFDGWAKPRLIPMPYPVFAR